VGDEGSQLPNSYLTKNIHFSKINTIMMLKAYEYRIYHNKNQIEMIKVHFGACRFVYNWTFEQKIKIYEQNKKSISRFDL
jgi:hypothetical protein